MSVVRCDSRVAGFSGFPVKLEFRLEFGLERAKESFSPAQSKKSRPDPIKRHLMNSVVVS